MDAEKFIKFRYDGQTAIINTDKICSMQFMPGGVIVKLDSQETYIIPIHTSAYNKLSDLFHKRP